MVVTEVFESPNVEKKYIDFALTPPLSRICEWIAQAESLEDGMKVLHESIKLGELGVRMRFFTARQLEIALSGLFPKGSALPFGSSVNGFGKAGSDLDLVFQYTTPPNDNSSRLMYQSKTSVVGPRPQTQRQMELIADLLQVMIPGCSGIKRILQARVPIVKYTNDITGLDCDFSLSNLSGVYMSELLFLMGQLDPAAKLLVTFVKTWASAQMLTNPIPGRWATNFTFTLLCIFYLQSIKRLPTVDYLVKHANKEDERITEDVNCTFCRDLNRLDWTVVPASPVDLLNGFFDFYADFDFGTKCISLNAGTTLSKPDYSPIYLVNPLEKHLNVAKNVSMEEIERFRMCAKSAAWVLESSSTPLADLIRPSSTKETLREFNSRYLPPRMVTVKDLFTES